MGTFIKELSHYLKKQNEVIKERDQRIAKQEHELKRAISALKIREEEKKSLKEQIDNLSKSSSIPDAFSDENLLHASSAYSSAVPSGIYFSEKPHTTIGHADPAGIRNTCTNCGKTFINTASEWGIVDGYFEYTNLCQDCRKQKLGG